MQPALVIAPPAPVTLPVEGETARFPVGRLFCIGRNYAAHAAEMGIDTREPPIFFMKPASAVLQPGADFLYPRRSTDVHHEVELVVAIGTGGDMIPEAQALSHVWGYGVGLDMTLRDLQAAAKAKGQPWESAKAFDGSAPLSALVPAARIGHPATGAIRLAVNGTVKQAADLSQMIWSVPAMIAELSRAFALLPGDLIMTGTPSGVAPVLMGDRLEAVVEGVATLAVTVR